MTLLFSTSIGKEQSQDLTPFVLVLLACGPVLVAIWCIPWFVTQDGPAHAYTAHLLARLTAGDDWLRQCFLVQAKPLPNLLAPAAMAALSSVRPGRFADRMLMSAALVLPAVTVIVLRATVRGTARMHMIIPFAVLLSLSRLWLLGFYSFLIGVALFNLTLAWWWRSRNETSYARAALLSLLLLMGWFAHLVTFAATVVAVAILTVATRKRVLPTVAAIAPTIPLAIWYFAVMKSHSGIGVSYVRLSGFSIGDLLQYARSIKVLSVAPQTHLPFLDDASPAFVLVAPAVLAAVAFITWWGLSVREVTRRGAAVRRPEGEAEPRPYTADPDGRAWFVVATMLLLGAIVAPDGLGLQHGGFLRERVFLLGLMTSVPAWNLSPGRASRIASAFAILALLVQSAFVWDYALLSNRRVGPLVAASPSIPNRSRVFVTRAPMREKFRASPALHAANLLGLSGDVVVWNHYQANLYFFPVNFRVPFIPCSGDGSCELRQHHSRIDRVVVWNRDRSGDEVVRQWFPRLLYQTDRLRVYGR